MERGGADQTRGERKGVVVDRFGHRGSIATRIEEVAPDELTRRMAAWHAAQAG